MPLSNAERQARYRARRRAGASVAPEPVRVVTPPLRRNELQPLLHLARDLLAALERLAARHPQPQHQEPNGHATRRSLKDIPQPIRSGKSVLWARVLSWMSQHAEPVTRKQLIAAFGVSAGEAQRALRLLCERGQAEKIAYGLYRATSDLTPQPGAVKE